MTGFAYYIGPPIPPGWATAGIGAGVGLLSKAFSTSSRFDRTRTDWCHVFMTLGPAATLLDKLGEPDSELLDVERQQLKFFCESFLYATDPKHKKLGDRINLAQWSRWPATRLSSGRGLKPTREC